MDHQLNKSSEGMRRRAFAGGAVHLLWDGSAIVLQVRTVGPASSVKNATGVAVKLGVALTAGEAAELAGELCRALALRASVAGDQREHPEPG